MIEILLYSWIRFVNTRQEANTGVSSFFWISQVRPPFEFDNGFLEGAKTRHNRIRQDKNRGASVVMKTLSKIDGPSVSLILRIPYLLVYDVQSRAGSSHRVCSVNGWKKQGVSTAGGGLIKHGITSYYNSFTQKGFQFEEFWFRVR